MRDSLFARASVRPAFSAARVEPSPIRAGDGVEHHVGFDIADELLGLDGSESGRLDLELRGLCLQHLCVRTGGETDQLESTRVGPDHIQCLGADGAGGAEDDDATHNASLGHAHGSPRGYCCCWTGVVARMSTTNTRLSFWSSCPSLAP